MTNEEHARANAAAAAKRDHANGRAPAAARHNARAGSAWAVWYNAAYDAIEQDAGTFSLAACYKRADTLAPDQMIIITAIDADGKATGTDLNEPKNGYTNMTRNSWTLA
jgi:hypothetical protein